MPPERFVVFIFMLLPQGWFFFWANIVAVGTPVQFIDRVPKTYALSGVRVFFFKLWTYPLTTARFHIKVIMFALVVHALFPIIHCFSFTTTQTFKPNTFHRFTTFSKFWFLPCAFTRQKTMVILTSQTIGTHFPIFPIFFIVFKHFTARFRSFFRCLLSFFMCNGSFDGFRFSFFFDHV